MPAHTWPVLAAVAAAAGAYGTLESKRRGASDAALVALVSVFDWSVHNPFCGLLFQCHCRFAWSWAEGWKNCNAHHETGPRCPWCICDQYLGGWACVFVHDLLVVAVALVVACAISGQPSFLAGAARALARRGRRRRGAGAAAARDDVEERAAMTPTRAGGADQEGCGSAGAAAEQAVTLKRFVLSALLPGIGAWVVYNTACGLAFFLATDYPYFLWVNLAAPA